MSQGGFSDEERNAYVEYKEGQNERKAHHHDESSQTLRLARVTLALVALCALGGVSIYAFEKLWNKSDKLATRSTDNHFHKAVAFELAADDRFEKSVAKLCYYIEKKGGQRIEYVEEAEHLGALITARWLEGGCDGDCKNLADRK
jgi:hypothetical protein